MDRTEISAQPVTGAASLLPGWSFFRQGRTAHGIFALGSFLVLAVIAVVRSERLWDGLLSLLLSLIMLVVDPRQFEVSVRGEIVEQWIASFAVVFGMIWLIVHSRKGALRPRVVKSIHELGHWELAWRYLRTKRLPLAGLTVIGILYAAALLSPLLAPHSPNAFAEGMVTQYKPPMSVVQVLLFHSDRVSKPDLSGTENGSRFADLTRLLRETNQRLTDNGISRVLFINGWHIESSDVVATVGLDVVRVPISELAGPEPEQFLSSRFFLLGTDSYGRDLLSRIMYGSRISLTLGLIAVLLSVTLGTAVGLIAGYFGRWVDTGLMRFVDILLALPSLFLILVIIAISESLPVPRIVLVVVVLGLTSWMGVARLVRAEVLSLKEREFIVAARAIGLSHARVLFRHVLPNTLTPVIVNATLRIGGIILIEAALSYLNLGVQQPTASWGNIIFEGKDVLSNAWWISTFPGFAIVLTVVSFNLLGDGLRDAFDPMTQSR
jgi:peptide/nickel transport system permease protein